MSDEEYVPEPEVKQEPADFWDEGPKAAPDQEEIPEEAEEPAGGRGKAIRERMRQIRLQKMQKEPAKENRDEMNLQEYRDAVAAHER